MADPVLDSDRIQKIRDRFQMNLNTLQGRAYAFIAQTECILSSFNLSDVTTAILPANRRRMAVLFAGGGSANFIVWFANNHSAANALGIEVPQHGQPVLIQAAEMGEITTFPIWASAEVAQAGRLQVIETLIIPG